MKHVAVYDSFWLIISEASRNLNFFLKLTSLPMAHFWVHCFWFLPFTHGFISYFQYVNMKISPASLISTHSPWHARHTQITHNQKRTINQHILFSARWTTCTAHSISLPVYGSSDPLLLDSLKTIILVYTVTVWHMEIVESSMCLMIKMNKLTLPKLSLDFLTACRYLKRSLGQENWLKLRTLVSLLEQPG